MKLPFIIMIWIVCCHFSAFSQQDISEVIKPVTDDEIALPSFPANGNDLLIKTDALRGSRHIVVEKKTKTTGVYWGLTAQKDTLFSISYRRNKLQGYWQSWYSSMQIIDSGRFENNLPDGEWKSWFPGGGLRTIRTYSAYHLMILQNEVARFNHKTSLNKLAILEKEQPGSYKYYTHPGYSFTGHFPNSQIIKLANNPLTDRSLYNRNTETNYIPPFNQCLHHGLFMNYFFNGEVKDSGYYENGLRTGIWLESLEEGNIISKGAYISGKKAYSWSFYNRNGKLVALKLFNNRGKEINSKMYD